MRRWRGRTASGPSRNEGQRDVVVRCRRRPHEVTNLSALAEQRQAKDDFFARHPQSPLTAAQRREFKGLRYYAENEALRLRLPLERGEQAERIIMDTSTGDRRVYLRAGTVRFEVEGQEAELALYAEEGADGHEFFVPFRDATSGRETYGAGRGDGVRGALERHWVFHPPALIGWGHSFAYAQNRPNPAILRLAQDERELCPSGHQSGSIGARSDALRRD